MTAATRALRACITGLKSFRDSELQHRENDGGGELREIKSSRLCNVATQPVLRRVHTTDSAIESACGEIRHVVGEVSEGTPRSQKSRLDCPKAMGEGGWGGGR